MNLHQLARYLRILHIRHRLRREIMADLTKLNASIQELDRKVAALLALPPVEDPAVQSGIDSATAAVDVVAAKIEAAHPGL